MADSIDVHDQAAYDALQAKLIPLWKSIERLNTDEQTIVVVPSAHIDVELAASLRTRSVTCSCCSCSASLGLA